MFSFIFDNLFDTRTCNDIWATLFSLSSSWKLLSFFLVLIYDFRDFLVRSFTTLRQSSHYIKPCISDRIYHIFSVLDFFCFVSQTAHTIIMVFVPESPPIDQQGCHIYVSGRVSDNKLREIWWFRFRQNATERIYEKTNGENLRLEYSHPT